MKFLFHICFFQKIEETAKNENKPSGINFNLNASKERKRLIIEQIEKAKADRKPFQVNRFGLKCRDLEVLLQKTIDNQDFGKDQTMHINKFIKNLDKNWNDIQDNMNLRTRYITTKSFKSPNKTFDSIYPKENEPEAYIKVISAFKFSKSLFY